MKGLEIFNLNKKRVAVAKYVFGVTETKKINGVGSLVFKLAANDEKAAYCQYRNFVRFNGGELYRIIDYNVEKNNASTIKYTCEHVIATLADTLLFGDHIVEGKTTANTIRYILSGQDDWVLNECDFSFHYDYAWTSETRITALLSVPLPFVDLHKFVFDTTIYPWRLSLKKIDTSAKPDYYIHERFNFLRSIKTGKSLPVITRLYCQGYGEGVNQLGIAAVNPTGKPYIEASAEAIAKYGIIEAHWCDRRFEDAQSLYNTGKAYLQKLQEPREEYEVNVADLAGASSNDYMLADIGNVIELRDDKVKTYITEIIRDHDVAGSMQLKLANTPADIPSTLADIANRQRIEATYSQGASQIWGDQLQKNATPSIPAVYKLWIPEATRNVNSVHITIELQRFQYYSQSTRDGGGSTQTSSNGGGGTQTSSNGGGSTQTSSSGGGGTQTSSNGGGSTQTSSNGGGGRVTSEGGGGYASAITTKCSTIDLYTSDSAATEQAYTEYETPTIANLQHRHRYNHDHKVTIPSSTLNSSISVESIQVPSHVHSVTTDRHAHSVTIPGHNHDVTIPSHHHSTSIPAHYHTVNTPSHHHNVTIPAHRHEIESGIFLASEMPTSATVKVGSGQSFAIGQRFAGDITKYLLGANASIPRGQFVDIAVTPNINAYVIIAVAPQGFIQSTGGGVY